MSCCFILASSDDRFDLLKRCVQCIKKNENYNNSDFFLYYQGHERERVKALGLFKEIIFDEKLRGIFTPRYELMKRFCLNYDFTIIIDDDLYMYPDTSYANCMDIMNRFENVGCCCIVTHRVKRKNFVESVSAKMGYYNVDGGLVLPKRSIKVILEYFSDKEYDYTEDMFWLLLYVKGFDLLKDYSSSAIHMCNSKVDGKYTGFSKMRTEKAHIPMLSEWFDSKIEYEPRYKLRLYKIKELNDINANGIAERKKNYSFT